MHGRARTRTTDPWNTMALAGVQHTTPAGSLIARPVGWAAAGVRARGGHDTLGSAKRRPLWFVSLADEVDGGLLVAGNPFVSLLCSGVFVWSGPPAACAIHHCDDETDGRRPRGVWAVEAPPGSRADSDDAWPRRTCNEALTWCILARNAPVAGCGNTHVQAHPSASRVHHSDRSRKGSRGQAEIEATKVVARAAPPGTRAAVG